MPGPIQGTQSTQSVHQLQQNSGLSAAQRGERVLTQLTQQGGVQLQGQLGFQGAQLRQVFQAQGLVDVLATQAQATAGAALQSGNAPLE